MEISFFIVATAIIVFLLFFFWIVPVGLWISAIAAGVKVNIGSLVGMRLRRVPPQKIILRQLGMLLTLLVIALGAIGVLAHAVV